MIPPPLRIFVRGFLLTGKKWRSTNLGRTSPPNRRAFTRGSVVTPFSESMHAAKWHIRRHSSMASDSSYRRGRQLASSGIRAKSFLACLLALSCEVFPEESTPAATTRAAGSGDIQATLADKMATVPLTDETPFEIRFVRWNLDGEYSAVVDLAFDEYFFVEAEFASETIEETQEISLEWTDGQRTTITLARTRNRPTIYRSRPLAISSADATLTRFEDRPVEP